MIQEIFRLAETIIRKHTGGDAPATATDWWIQRISGPKIIEVTVNVYCLDDHFQVPLFVNLETMSIEEAPQKDI